MKKQAGFTLIELVMVIVILGILAAVALPKFVDLGSDAKMAAVKGVAGALSSGGTINYAQRSVAASGAAASGVATSGVSCATVATSLFDGGVTPAGYTVTGTVPDCKVADDTLAVASAVARIPAIN